jgi:small subunit ribosomal protein S1
VTEPTPPPPPEEEEEEEEDFARMLEESLQQPKRFREGDLVEGSIVALGTDVAFVDVGGKGEAQIDLAELTDEDGKLMVDVGDKVKALVVSTDGGVKLSHKLARHAATREALRDAYESGLPVEGRVEQSIKGGFEIRFSGQRAFCPISQIEAGYTEDPTVHLGKVYAFRVVECKQEGRDIVVSRRAILEEEARERAEEVRKLIVPDAVLPGKVVSVRDYGAFVDLGGGIQGLLHVSEMGWSRISDPSTVVQPGDEITVKVLHVDEEKGKISLGLKQLQVDPWTDVAEKYAVGQVWTGRVTRIADFGAFIELEPGIEALAHVSTFPPTGKTDGWKAAVPTGAAVAVEVLSVDSERKRIGVAVLEEGSTRAERAKRGAPEGIRPGARLTGRVEKHEPYGVFVFLAPGKTGLIPNEETGVDRDADLRKSFPVGSDVEVLVLDVDAAGRRIRLSRKAVLEEAEKRVAQEYAERESEAERAQGGFGSLAESLRKAIEKSEG